MVLRLRTSVLRIRQQVCRCFSILRLPTSRSYRGLHMGRQVVAFRRRDRHLPDSLRVDLVDDVP